MTAISLTHPTSVAPSADTGRLRVALFTDTFVPQFNGVARTLSRVVDALRNRDVAVRVYTTTDPRSFPVPNVKRVASVPFWAYPELRLALPIAGSLSRDVADWGANVVHIATPFGVGCAGRTIARTLGVPLLTSYHTSLAAYAPLYGLGALSEPGWHYLRWFHNGGAATLAPTAAIAADLRVRGFRRVAVWGRGVDPSTFNPHWRSDALRRELGVGDDGVLVGYVGRLAKEKRVDVLLDAIDLARPRLENVVFAVVGDGPQAQYYRTRASNDTRFLGRLDGSALSAFYASCDMLVFPSDTDTFGNVLLEGMASGLAIVAADTPVTREVLAGGQAGAFYPAADSAELAARIVALTCAASARRELGRIALLEARRRTWDRVFDSLLESYVHVTRRSRRLHAAQRVPASTSR